MLQAALSYAKRGWPVLPLHSIIDGHCSCTAANCTSPAKHPCTQHGLTDASVDPQQLATWWATWPTANIGIATGQKSRIVVLDCDTKNGGPDRLRELMDLHGAINTLTSITGGGGQHWVFQAPPEALKNSAGIIALGIDTRAEGGYIVAPPSIHLSGQKYEWDTRISPQPVPAWLLSLWPTIALPATSKNGAPPTEGDPHWVTDALAYGAGDGERNNMATRLVGYFHAKEMPRDVILAVVKPFAERCRPPMELPELHRTINSVLRYQSHLRNADISDPPEFSEHASSLIYRWPNPGVSITVDQLRRNNLGLQCEIVIKSDNQAIHGPVHYNLTSTSGRDTLVRYLLKRMDIDWPEILESLSRLTVAYNRSGDPVSNLKEYLIRPGNQWVLRPFILEDQPTILFGAGGLGKSVLALAMMLSLESGKSILPGVFPTAGHGGLYLDWEDTEYQHGERYRQITAGANLNPADYDLFHLRCTGTIADQAQRIHHQIADSGATFLVIDSAGMACGGEPEKSEAALMFFSTLRTFQRPALIIAHQTKNNARGMPFGSVFFHNSARMTWEITSKQSITGGALNIALTNRKSNVSALLGTIGFTIQWANDAISIKSYDTTQDYDLAKLTPLEQRIYTAIAPGASTVRAIALETRASEGSVRTILNKNRGTLFEQDASAPGPPLWGVIEEV